VYPRALPRSVLSLGAVAAALVASIAAPAYAGSGRAEPAVSPPSAAAPGRVASITEGLARELATAFTNQAARNRIVSAAAAGPVDLATVEPGTRLADAVRAANRDVLAAKGLPATGDSLLRLRLAHPGMRAALARGEVPLVAATPMDDDVTGVTGYDHRGGQVRLDATRMPERPVLLVEVDTTKALEMGLRVMNETLTAYGISRAAPSVTAAGGYWATKVNAIRLNDDKEPWIKGAAEIFCIVGGFGLDGKVKIDTVQMPYLDHDNTTYYPNQLLVHFSAYKYNLADVVMMEDDGDTNYQQLAQAIANALLYIVDGGAYTPLVNAILGAMPNSWWTDDPDYVDSWYTLATTSSGRLYGAAGNGWMDVVPYWVSEL